MKTAKYADAAPAPPSLCVRLLGGFSVTFEGGSSIAVDAPRLQSLLAYVVLHRDSSESPNELQARAELTPSSAALRARGRRVG